MVTHVYKDSAITGKTDKRPEFQRLLKDCAKKSFDAVIVYSIDRFGRNLSQSLGNASKIEECDICPAFCDRGIYKYTLRAVLQKYDDVQRLVL